MCLILTKHEPNSTRLINIPITYCNKKYKLFIYTNDMKIDKGNALMIVPFPKNAGDIGLVDVSTSGMKKFRKILFTECEKLKPLRPRTRSWGDMLLCSNQIKNTVYEIGNYNISVANNFDELINNIDWNKFNRPYDFNERISVMKNKEIYPEDEYFYVVAEAFKSIENDGFGIVYPDCGYDYFPTAHEKMGQVSYDVKLYNFFDIRRNYILFDKMYIRSYQLNHPIIFNNMLRNINTTMTMVHNGEVGNFEISRGIRPNCNFFEMKEYHKNSNLCLYNSNIDDIIQPIYYQDEI